MAPNDYRLILLPQALCEIDEAQLWYASVSVRLGDRFLNHVAKTLIAITAFPLSYRIRYEDFRIAVMRAFPYRIFFTVYKGSIVVNALRHASRDPDTDPHLPLDS